MSVQDSITRGAYHISNNTVEYNPQRKNNFTLIVNNLNNLPRVGSVDSSLWDLVVNDYIKDGQNQLILALKTCDTPQVTQNPITINRGNSTIKFAGKPSFNDINIEAYDFIGSNVKDTLLAWQNLSYNTKYDYVGNAWSYKKDCQLLQLDPVGNLIRYWEIKGAWLQSVTPGNFSVDDGDTAQTVSATISYDWAELHLPDEYNG